MYTATLEESAGRLGRYLRARLRIPSFTTYVRLQCVSHQFTLLCTRIKIENLTLLQMVIFLHV